MDTETIKYVIEVDDAGAEAKIKKLFTKRYQPAPLPPDKHTRESDSETPDSFKPRKKQQHKQQTSPQPEDSGMEPELESSPEEASHFRASQLKEAGQTLADALDKMQERIIPSLGKMDDALKHTTAVLQDAGNLPTIKQVDSPEQVSSPYTLQGAWESNQKMDKFDVAKATGLDANPMYGPITRNDQGNKDVSAPQAGPRDTAQAIQASLPPAPVVPEPETRGAGRFLKPIGPEPPPDFTYDPPARKVTDAWDRIPSWAEKTPSPPSPAPPVPAPAPRPVPVPDLSGLSAGDAKLLSLLGRSVPKEAAAGLSVSLPSPAEMAAPVPQINAPAPVPAPALPDIPLPNVTAPPAPSLTSPSAPPTAEEDDPDPSDYVPVKGPDGTLITDIDVLRKILKHMPPSPEARDRKVRREERLEDQEAKDQKWLKGTDLERSLPQEDPLQGMSELLKGLLQEHPVPPPQVPMPSMLDMDLEGLSRDMQRIEPPPSKDVLPVERGKAALVDPIKEKKQKGKDESKSPEPPTDMVGSVGTVVLGVVKRFGPQIHGVMNSVFKLAQGNLVGGLASAGAGATFGGAGGMISGSIGGGAGASGAAGAGAAGAGAAGALAPLVAGAGAVAGVFAGIVVGAGAVIGTFGMLTSQVMGVASTLKEYNGQLFSAMTGLDFFVMGFKYQLAEALGGGLSEVALKLQELATASLPSIIGIFNAVLPAVSSFLDGMTELVTALGPGLVSVVGSVMGSLTSLMDIIVKMLPVWEALLAGVIAGTWVFNKLILTLELTVDSINVVFKAIALGFWAVVNGFASAFESVANELIDIVNHIWSYLPGEQDGIDHVDLNEVTGLAQDAALADMKKATDSFGKTLKELIGATDETAKSMTDNAAELRDNGRELSLTLFRAAEDWSKSIGKVSKQTPDAYIPKRDAMPQLPVNTGTAAQQVDRSNMAPGGYPRPSPAAVTFHTADTVNIQAADEDRLHNELLLLKNQVMDKLADIHNARWLKISMARHNTLRGM